MAKTKTKIEFGDFQTPIELALGAIEQITELESFDRIIEPTCGVGTFLCALIKKHVSPSKLEGWEINPNYVNEANDIISKTNNLDAYQLVKEQDFFTFDFSTLDLTHRKFLFLGNPPWVTNSELGRLLSGNLPDKANFQGVSGLEAMTGKSNFDISEWMLIQLLKIISGTTSSIAFLIKTSVARKLFEYACKNALNVSNFKLKNIDAKKHFDVSVHACLFLVSGCKQKVNKNNYSLTVYSELRGHRSKTIMGFVNGKLISDINAYEKYKKIDSGSEFKWRSGVKHDASKIMEFDVLNGSLVNGLGEKVKLPNDYLYPMYKSSSISKEILAPPKKKMLVTQRKIGDDTQTLQSLSPDTWKYLCEHSEQLDSRKSSIYRASPRFSVFGVGDYSFKPWKVVISGLYKNIKFSKIGCYDDKPIVIDDTCYMLGFDTEQEAEFVLSLLQSKVCQNFISSIVFLDNKRPITAALLSRINFKAISKILGLEEKYERLFYANSM